MQQLNFQQPEPFAFSLGGKELSGVTITLIFFKCTQSLSYLLILMQNT